MNKKNKKKYRGKDMMNVKEIKELKELVNILVEKVKRLEDNNEKIIEITKDYYNFWLYGTALEPIYKRFVDRLEELKT